MSSSSHSDTYFYTPSLKHLLQQIVHLAYFGDGFSLVLGARQSGKSRLAGELGKRFDQAHDVVTLAAPPQSELGDALELIAVSLGIAGAEQQSIGELLAALRRFVQALVQDRKLVVLIVDDAQRFDDQTIGALISLLQGKVQGNVGLHVVFLGEPGLEQRIDALQIIDVAVYDFDMPAFSPSEMAAFLNERNASVQGLTSAQVQKLWAASKGLPGAALTLLRGEGDAEESGERVSQAVWRSGVPLGHIAAVVLLALVLFWSFAWRAEDDTEVLAQTTPTPTATLAATPIVRGVDTDEETVAEGMDARKWESIAHTAPTVLPTPVSTSGSSDQAGETPLTAVDPSSPDPAPTLSSAPETTSLVSATPMPVASPEVQSSEAPPRGEGVARQASVLPATEPSSRSNDLSSDEAFIMAQNPKHYALQVIAASQPASLAAFVARQKNRDNLKMYRGLREGKRWFVVVEGVYSTREAAMQSRKLLPDEQAKGGPWPRLFSSIQEEIETFRRELRE